MQKRSSRLSLAVLLIAGALPSPSSAQTDSSIPVVTLTEARRRSITVDPNSVAARSRIETASWERRAATLNLLTPSLRATTNYTHFSDPFFNFGTGGVSPNSASATLDANYSILGFGKFGALKSSRASLVSAEAGETVARFRTALE